MWNISFLFLVCSFKFINLNLIYFMILFRFLFSLARSGRDYDSPKGQTVSRLRLIQLLRYITMLSDLVVSHPTIENLWGKPRRGDFLEGSSRLFGG